MNKERILNRIRKAMRDHKRNNPTASRDDVRQAGLQEAKNQGVDIEKVDEWVKKILEWIELILAMFF